MKQDKQISFQMKRHMQRHDVLEQDLSVCQELIAEARQWDFKNQSAEMIADLFDKLECQMMRLHGTGSKALLSLYKTSEAWGQLQGFVNQTAHMQMTGEHD